MSATRCVAFILLLGALLVAAVPLHASVNVPVGDDVYDDLGRLEAEGLIESGLLDTRPLSRREVLRLVLEAEKNLTKGHGSYLRRMVSDLKHRYSLKHGGGTSYFKPLESAYLTYVHSDSGLAPFSYNNEGDHYGEGSNQRVGFTSSASLGPLSFYLNPEYRYSDDDDGLELKSAYGRLEFWGLGLTVGKEALWWGPGRNGAILLSNNAEALTMVRLTNPEPGMLPWIFKYLGPARFSLFAAQLGENRAVPEPYLWGLRLSFRPSPYFRIAFSRTAMLGGRGRNNDPEIWWKSFIGSDENKTSRTDRDEPGDQRGGLDIEVTLPFELQPLQVYLEAHGEDESNYLPSDWAYIGGIYLPRILSLERVEFRAEYANTYVPVLPLHLAWYNHKIFGSGYTHEGDVIGHHIGTASESQYFELIYNLKNRKGRLLASYEQEKDRDGAPRYSRTQGTLAIKYLLSDRLVLRSRAVTGTLENEQSGEEQDETLLLLSLEYNL